MVESKLRLIRLMTNKNVLDILQRLQNGPARFTDLAEACPSVRLRSLRLADLTKNGLIQKKAIGVNENLQVVYQITEKGKKLAEEVKKLL